MSDWLTAISVISAATVSVLSVFLPSYYERRRRKEDKIDAEVKKIDETTLDFLRNLSKFRHWDYDSLEKIAEDRAVQYLYTDLQVTQYAWERAIWSRLDAQGRDKIKSIRTRLEGVHTPNDLSRGVGDSDVPALADEILALARSVNGR
ncbi:MAG TPA: hypothetical protein PKH77_15370 [Anaerolineae bacterium]|nr:hypothetical protein [Anaerolineae bacterium]